MEFFEVSFSHKCAYSVQKKIDICDLSNACWGSWVRWIL